MNPVKIMKLMTAVALTPILTLSVAFPALGAGAHVHGEATLSVAIDSQMVTLVFDSPLDNLVGFEHAPRTEKQKQAMVAMAARLGEHAKLFVLDAAAGCASVGVKLAPEAGTDFVTGTAAKEVGKATHKDQEAAFTFRCKDVAKLRAIEVKLFEAFPRVKRIKASVAGPKQLAMTLTPAKATLRW